jgi:hypothetical protein
MVITGMMIQRTESQHIKLATKDTISGNNILPQKAKE